MASPDNYLHLLQNQSIRGETSEQQVSGWTQLDHLLTDIHVHPITPELQKNLNILEGFRLTTLQNFLLDETNHALPDRLIEQLKFDDLDWTFIGRKEGKILPALFFGLPKGQVFKTPDDA